MSYLRAGRSSSKPPRMSAVTDAGAVRRLVAAEVKLLIVKRYPKSRADASARAGGTMSRRWGYPKTLHRGFKSRRRRVADVMRQNESTHHDCGTDNLARRFCFD